MTDLLSCDIPVHCQNDECDLVYYVQKRKQDRTCWSCGSQVSVITEEEAMQWVTEALNL